MAAAAGAVPTPSIFAPVFSPAFEIREVSLLVCAITTLIFIGGTDGLRHHSLPAPPR
jgi:hypothetical protein